MFSIITIDDSHHSVLECAETKKKFNDGLSAQITLSNDSAKIRGLHSNVRDAKSRLTDQIT